MIFKNINKIKTFLLIIIILPYLNSCGIYRKVDAKEYPPEPEKRIKKNMEEGRGFRLSEIGKNKGGGDFQFASSNPMWRAAIDKLSFAPLSNVDYAGGIIVTDWFGESSSTDQIKITTRFLTNEIRSDAIDIIIHKKICDQANNCQINKIENNLNSELKLAILKKAAVYESEKDTKDFKEYDVVTIPEAKN